MAESTIEFGEQLYNELQQAMERLNNEEEDNILDDIYDKQHRYDTLVRELAIKSEVISIIPDLIKQKKSSTFEFVAWHIVMLSGDLGIFDKMLKCFDSGQVWGPDKALHLLNEGEASTIVQYLSEKKNKDYLQIASKYVTYNRLVQHLNLFIENSQFIDESFFTFDISLIQSEQILSALNQLILQEKDGEDIYCNSLLRQKQAIGLDYARKNISSKSNFLGWYGDQEDLQIYLNFIEQQPLEYRYSFLKDVLIYGNLYVIKWLFKQLSSSNVEMRMAAFKKMSQVFLKEIYQDDEFDGISEVYDYIDEFEFDEDEWDSPLLSAQHMQQLWSEIQGKLVQIRDFDKRYGGVVNINEQFDLLKALRFRRYDSNRLALGNLIAQMVVYTGQSFPFDPYAYMEKQEAQLDVWEQYLEKNRDKFLPGRWVRWGEYIDE